MIVCSPCSPFAPAFHIETGHGLVVGVHIPTEPAPVPEHVLAMLQPEERAFAITCRAYRQVQFVGGRLALGAALRAVGKPGLAVLPDQHGAPTLPAGLAGSISHTRDLAVAIVGAGEHRLGIDIEDTGRPSSRIAARVLCADELEAIGCLDEHRRQLELMTRFSIKEAAYKSLHPFELRHIGFHEIAVWPDEHGGARVELRFECGWLDHLEATHTHFEGKVLSVVAAHPRNVVEGGKEVVDLTGIEPVTS